MRKVLSKLLQENFRSRKGGGTVGARVFTSHRITTEKRVGARVESFREVSSTKRTGARVEPMVPLKI